MRMHSFVRTRSISSAGGLAISPDVQAGNARSLRHSWRWRARLGLALATGLITVMTSTGVTSAAVTRNLSVTHAKETDKKWCVPASVWMELKQQGVSPPSQASLYQEGLQKKRCNVGVDSGLDPLAWAWLLYSHTPAGYLYDDFTYSSAYSGTINMANQLYERGEVAGALVNAGHHAMVFKGATTSCNLSLDSCWQSSPTVSSVYVDDPWFDWNTNTAGKDADGCAGTGGNYVCGKIGLAPNTMISYATWTSFYYTPWTRQNCAYWNNKWVAVLRKSTGLPSGPVQMGATKDPAFGPTVDPDPGVEYPTPSMSPVVSAAASAAISDLDRTFIDAKTTHGLKDRAELTDALDGGHITKTLRVRSLVTNFPDYLLANVVGRHGLRGVAMFTLADPAHPEFAGMTVSDTALGQYPLVSVADARKAVTGQGLTLAGEPELVWGWSTTTNSPYYPLWKVSTTDGKSRYVTSMGQVIEDLDLQATPRN